MLVEDIASMVAILILVLGIFAIGAPILAHFIQPDTQDHQHASSEVQKLTEWLLRQVMHQSPTGVVIHSLIKNRVKGAAVKALYYLKKNQSVRIQLPNLIPTEHGYTDFEISMDRNQLQHICHPFDSGQIEDTPTSHAFKPRKSLIEEAKHILTHNPIRQWFDNR